MKLIKKFGNRVLLERKRLLGHLLMRRLRSQFHTQDVSIVSSNCLGARLCQLAGNPYRSPTVDLWFEPDDYLTYVRHIGAFCKATIAPNEVESQKMGYPVGVLTAGPSTPAVKIHFMHYENIDVARDAWDRRSARLDLSKTILVHTDREGATEAHLRAFDALPFPKIAFTSRKYPDIASTCYVKGYEQQGYVGDLYGEWEQLVWSLTSRRLSTLTS